MEWKARDIISAWNFLLLCYIAWRLYAAQVMLTAIYQRVGG